MSLLLWALPSVDLWRRCALLVLFFVSGRRPGLRPGGRLTFFVSPKKVSKGRAAGIRSLRAAKLREYQRRPDVPALLRRVRCAAQLGRGLAKLAALKQTRALFPPKSALLAVPDGRVGAGADGCCCAAASVEPDLNQGSRFALLDTCLVEGRRPGLRPGGRLTFFASPKKVSKKRRPDVHALLRRVRCAAQLGRGLAKLAALKQTRALYPPKSALLAVPDGRVGAGTDGCCCAAAPCCFTRRARLLRSADGRMGALPNTSNIGPRTLLDAPSQLISSVRLQARPHPIPLAPWGRAEQRSARGIRPRVCLSVSEFSGDPPGASSAGNHEVALTSGRLSLLTFFGEAKKVRRPPGRNPGLRPQPKSRTCRAKRHQHAAKPWTRHIPNPCHQPSAPLCPHPTDSESPS